MTFKSRLLLLPLAFSLILPSLATAQTPQPLPQEEIGEADTFALHGRLDATGDLAVPMGTFNGVPYIKHNLRFNGRADGSQYHMNAWILAPQQPSRANGRVVMEIMNTVDMNILGELQPARAHIGDHYMFENCYVYATVRWDIQAATSPKRVDPDLPLDTVSPSDTPRSIGFSILSDFAAALRADPTAHKLAGRVHRVYGYGYSQSGWILRSLLLQPPATSSSPIFDGSLVGGAGAVRYDMVPAQTVFDGQVVDPTPIPSSAGKVIAFNTETEIPLWGAAAVRQTASHYRVYEYAGAAHLPQPIIAPYANQDASVGIPDVGSANPLMWYISERALLTDLDLWVTCNVPPPANTWLGAPGDSTIARDANGNALGGVRFPDVHVGRGTYIAFDPTYASKFMQWGGQGYIFRAIAGGFVDLAANFSSHLSYVSAVSAQAAQLVTQRFLTPADAAQIIQTAEASSVGS